MRLTIAFVLGLVAGVGLTFWLALLAGRDAQRQRTAVEG
jgi:capsular polysaccharide biosynthesis protein